MFLQEETTSVELQFHSCILKNERKLNESWQIKLCTSPLQHTSNNHS